MIEAAARMIATATHIESAMLDEYMVRGWDRRSWLAKVGDAISQLANAIAGGAPDESLSGRSYRICILEQSPPLRWRIVRSAAEALFWIKDRGNHTQLAFWEDVYRSRSRGRAADLFDRAVALRTFDAQRSLSDATADTNPED